MLPVKGGYNNIVEVYRYIGFIYKTHESIHQIWLISNIALKMLFLFQTQHHEHFYYKNDPKAEIFLLYKSGPET